MNDITVIILTKNEEKNIEKCITSAWLIAKRVVVVDCGSTDETVSLAKESGADVYFHEWETHARQFNWALDNCDIVTPWIYRLDADERITQVLAQEIETVLDDPSCDNYAAYAIRWDMYFMGKWLKHGGCNNTYVTRLFKNGMARVEDKAMDERFVVDGDVKNLKSAFIHYDYKGIDAWLEKHIKYSQLELDLYNGTYAEDLTDAENAQKKKRSLYYRLPPFFRARLYYWYRYYVQRGFLDGREGKIFLYLQAYWYRFLVDAKIYEQSKNEKAE